MSHSSPVRVVRTEARSLLGKLPARSVTLLMSDAPYQTVDRHGSGHLRRWFRGSVTWAQIAAHLAIAKRRLRPDGLVMVLVNESSLAHAQAAMRTAGFARQRLIVWDQRRPGLGTGLRHQVGYVVVGLQPASRTLAGSDLISAASVAPTAKDRYPTEKPVELGRQLAAIAGIRRGDVVVDPFCGSGNLLVGAAERGATVIAGDTSARAVRLASARLTAATARGRPSLEGRSRKAATAYRNSARSALKKRSAPKPKRVSARRATNRRRGAKR